jgi:HSP20 family molecular chaperone IbpA
MFKNLIKDLDDLMRNDFKHPLHTNNNYSSSDLFDFSNSFLTKKTYNSYISNDDNWIIELLCPGIEKEDIDIFLENKVLSIKLKDSLKIENQYKKEFKKIIEKNFSLGILDFDISFKNENSYDLTKITSHLKNGILKIVIPPSKVDKNKEKIDIKIS